MNQVRLLAALVIICAGALQTSAIAQPIVLPTIANPDFETGAAAFVQFPGYTSPTNPLNPAQIPSWPGTGNRGINPGLGAGTPFRDNGNNATNVAFLQSSGTNIGQSISGWEVGKSYRVAFDYNVRNSGTGPQPGITATIGAGSFVDTLIQPVSAAPGSNSYYTGNILFTPTSTTHTLSVTANMGAADDRTVLVDNFSVFRNGPTIANNGFEAPVFADNSFKYAVLTPMTPGELTAAVWTMTGNAGITHNISGFQNTGDRAPEGEQHAILQATSLFSQAISGFEVGADYDMSLFARTRGGDAGPNDLEVYLDFGLSSQINLLDQLISNADFEELTTSTFTALKSDYLLTFRTTNPLGGDRTTFVDDMFFNQLTTAALAVPEPATWLVWSILGAGMMGIVVWRRRMVL